VFGDDLERLVTHFGEAGSGLRDQRRLVAPAAVGDGGEERRIGFDQQPVGRRDGRGFALRVASFERGFEPPALVALAAKQSCS